MHKESSVDMDTQAEQLLEELLDLRRAVAEVLGRDQYVYHVIDEAVESQHTPTMAEALRAIEHQSDDVRQHLVESKRHVNHNAIR